MGALVAAGYQVIAVNPMSTSRPRERHSELARTNAHHHRPVAGVG